MNDSKDENLPETTEQPMMDYQIYCEDENGVVYSARLDAINIEEVKEKIKPRRLISAFGIKKGV